MKIPQRDVRGPTAFTLVELMVSVVIVMLLMLLLLTITDATRKTWVTTTARAEQFRGARAGFESMTRRLSQATLNTYWDYFDASGAARTPENAATFVPTRYARQSELRFISGRAASLNLPSTCPTHAVFFQAPLGFVADRTNYSRMENLLNTWGYFIQFGDDSLLRPTFVTKTLAPYRSRFRLMELMEPSETMTLYVDEANTPGGSSAYVLKDWFTKPFRATPQPARVLAENIVALVLLPKLTPSDQAAGKYNDGSLAPGYLYDSTTTGESKTGKLDANLNTRNQLPPVIQITMVAVEETSFSRFQKAATTMPALGLSSLFTTVGDTADPAKAGYAKDLQTLQTNLVTSKPPLTYRVFSTNVSIKGAKWSREQAN